MNITPSWTNNQATSIQVTPKQLNGSVTSVAAKKRDFNPNQTQVFNVDITMNITGNVNFFTQNDEPL